MSVNICRRNKTVTDVFDGARLRATASEREGHIHGVAAWGYSRIWTDGLVSVPQGWHPGGAGAISVSQQFLPLA